jgi:hypothetical protein
MVEEKYKRELHSSERLSFQLQISITITFLKPLKELYINTFVCVLQSRRKRIKNNFKHCG